VIDRQKVVVRQGGEVAGGRRVQTEGWSRRGQREAGWHSGEGTEEESTGSRGEEEMHRGRGRALAYGMRRPLCEGYQATTIVTARGADVLPDSSMKERYVYVWKAA
jgi:hypothetical protein